MSNQNSHKLRVFGRKLDGIDPPMYWYVKDIIGNSQGWGGGVRLQYEMPSFVCCGSQNGVILQDTFVLSMNTSNMNNSGSGIGMYASMHIYIYIYIYWELRIDWPVATPSSYITPDEQETHCAKKVTKSLLSLKMDDINKNQPLPSLKMDEMNTKVQPYSDIKRV